AEDGIRDFHVTGVQTCALPIYDLGHRLAQHEKANTRSRRWLSIAGNVVGALGGPNIGGAGQALALRKRPEQEVEADRAGIDLAEIGRAACRESVGRAGVAAGSG